MSNIGGYEIIDFGGVNLGSNIGGHVDGIYEKLDNAKSNGKANLISGIYYEDDRIDDFYSSIVYRDYAFYLLISIENGVGRYVKVEADDDVSIVEQSLGGGGSGAGLITIDVSDIFQAFYNGGEVPNFDDRFPDGLTAPFIIKCNDSLSVVALGFDKAQWGMNLLYEGIGVRKQLYWSSFDNYIRYNVDASIPTARNILSTIGTDTSTLKPYIAQLTQLIGDNYSYTGTITEDDIVNVLHYFGSKRVNRSQLATYRVEESGFTKIVIDDVWTQAFGDFTISFSEYQQVISFESLRISGNSDVDTYKTLKINISNFNDGNGWMLNISATK